MGEHQGLKRPAVDRLDVRVCRLPTEGGPRSDGTHEWSATTMVIAEVCAGGASGIGYTYGAAAAAAVIRDRLAPCVVGGDALAVPAAAGRMARAVRNDGRPGIAACAIAAVDIALWDLKARLVDLPLAELLGVVHRTVPVYASGGFTSTSVGDLAEEVAGYAAAGHRRVKIKIGRKPEEDLERARVAREAAGARVELMVDANGSYQRKQALALADALAAHGVVYFEEPVSSDDLEGLRLLRDRAPMAIAAGEYGYDAAYFRRMLEAGAVDVLQADATRCLGISGFLQADALCAAHATPLSSHCAPALHLHAAAAATRLVHLEQFRDHVRMEAMLFDGAPEATGGALAYDPHRPGLGLTLRRAEADRLAL